MAERCTAIGGDFFVEVPTGGDVYLLSQILHDWDDERSTEILRQCRRAIPAHGKLLVVELVLPPGEEPFFGKWLDLHMRCCWPASAPKPSIARFSMRPALN